MKKTDLSLLVVILSCLFCRHSVSQEFEAAVEIPEIPQAILNLHGYASMEEYKAQLQPIIKSGRYDLLQLDEPKRFFHNPENLNSSISLVLENDFFKSKLELTDEQLAGLKDTQREYESLVVAIQSKEDFVELDMQAKHEILGRERQKFLQDTRQILSPTQLKELSLLGKKKNVGVPKMLLLSSVGEYLELDSKQREEISQRSEKLAKEIKEFQVAKRLEAFKILKQTLNPTQLKKLNELRDFEEITRAISRASLERLFTDHYLKDNAIKVIRMGTEFIAKEK